MTQTYEGKVKKKFDFTYILYDKAYEQIYVAHQNIQTPNASDGDGMDAITKKIVSENIMSEDSFGKTDTSLLRRMCAVTATISGQLEALIAAIGRQQLELGWSKKELQQTQVNWSTKSLHSGTNDDSPAAAETPQQKRDKWRHETEIRIRDKSIADLQSRESSLRAHMDMLKFELPIAIYVHHHNDLNSDTGKSLVYKRPGEPSVTIKSTEYPSAGNWCNCNKYQHAVPMIVVKNVHAHFMFTNPF